MTYEISYRKADGSYGTTYVQAGSHDEAIAKGRPFGRVNSSKKLTGEDNDWGFETITGRSGRDIRVRS